jgi:hypothetical protein
MDDPPASGINGKVPYIRVKPIVKYKTNHLITIPLSVLVS